MTLVYFELVRLQLPSSVIKPLKMTRKG